MIKLTYPEHMNAPRHLPVLAGKFNHYNPMVKGEVFIDKMLSRHLFFGADRRSWTLGK